MKWNDIDNCHTRAKVPGGWLVKAYEDVSRDIGDGCILEGWEFRIAMAFVPDPRHEWDLANFEGDAS